MSSEHLTGPWVAIISHRDEAYPDIRTALIELGENREVDVSVRRHAALPDDDGYLPDSYVSGDVAYELTGLYFDGDGDLSTGAEARFAQAQAMAAGLNAAAAS